MKNSTLARLIKEFFKKNEIIGCFKVFPGRQAKNAADIGRFTNHLSYITTYVYYFYNNLYAHSSPRVNINSVADIELLHRSTPGKSNIAYRQI